MQMPEETPCARAGLEEVDTKSLASTAEPDFRLTFIVGLILEEKL